MIVGAASALQAQHERLPEAERRRLLGEHPRRGRPPRQRHRNTCNWSACGGAVEPQRGWESIEEIVGAVLARVRGRDPARRIQSHVPADLP